jgi:transcriptional regulator with XRE-family HTH domain
MNARALVARNIRRLRVMRVVSQEALAVDAGIDRTYVSRLERGRENPTVAVLEQISRALRVEITDFFVVPKPSEKPTAPLPSGRKKRRPS